MRPGNSAVGRDRKLTRVLYDQVTEAQSGSHEVGEQRERNHRYYTLQKLGNEQKGRSQYISPDVFDVVEAKKSYFSEVFLSPRSPAKFTADDTITEIEADQRTAYAQLQFRRNKIHRLFRDGWHDAFVAKKLVAIAEWGEDTTTYTQQIDQMPMPMLQQMLAEIEGIVDIDDSGLQIIQGGPMPILMGSVDITVDTSKVEITLVQPERWYRDPNVAYIDEAMYAGYEEDLARVTLIDRGYDRDQVMNLRSEYRYRRDEEDSARKAHDMSWTRRHLHNRTDETEVITVFRTWTFVNIADYFDLNGESADGTDFDTLQLWEIHWVEGEILKKDGSYCIYPAEEIPAFEWTEHKISHAEHGLATADVVAHTQKTNSTLKRLVIDNQHLNNTTRYQAMIGGVHNPRELLDQTIGGVVWTTTEGAVREMAAPQLSPVTFNVIEMMDQDKEERSGVSRLAQGLNTDAVRYQNADDMIARLTNAANRRIMQSARDFAEEFYTPLMQYMVKLGARHDTKTYTVEVAGKRVQITPSSWNELDTEARVHVALTPEEALRHAQNLMMVHQMMSQDPHMNLLYGIAQKHAVFDEIFEAIGITDTTRFLLRPDSPEFQQQMMQQTQRQTAQQQKAEQMQQVQLGMMQKQDMREDRKLQQDDLRIQIDATDKAADNMRADDQFQHERVIDLRTANREDKKVTIDARRTG